MVTNPSMFAVPEVGEGFLDGPFEGLSLSGADAVVSLFFFGLDWINLFFEKVNHYFNDKR